MEHNDDSKCSCPIHGKKYMFREGRNGNVERKGALYCHFPTPNEDFSMCFYHPGHGVGRELLALKARDKDGRVYEAKATFLPHEWKVTDKTSDWQMNYPCVRVIKERK